MSARRPRPWHGPFRARPVGLVPLHCAVCRAPGRSLCAGCADRLAPSPEPGSLPGLDAAVALFAYDGAGRHVVGALKFRNHRDALGPLASMLAGAVDAAAGPFDVVTWVPTTARRRRDRGYDQAQLLATAVGRTLGAPVRPLLRRAGATSQTGRTRAARLSTEFHPRRPVPGVSVLVVDDVRTTGASLSAAALALRRGGAAAVVGATLAATPRPSSRSASDRASRPLQC